jgi:hypothetical protein
MRKQLLASAALLLGAVAFSAPSSADVFVLATATLDKDTTVTENLRIFKNVTIVVDADFTGNSGAESVSIINQANSGNVVTLISGALGNRLFADLLATIDTSINENVGITQVNQDVGSSNNQANSVNASASATQAFFTESMIEVEQYTIGNVAVTDGTATFAGGNLSHATKAALMSNSVNGNVGITQVNQNAGSVSNQLNAIDLAVGANAAVALSEAALGQTNTGNHVDEIATVKVSSMVSSVNANTGITMVNQNSGNMNQQGTVISFAGSFGFGN